jgi:Na+-transporting methylmalonyl-CoA/oxaloacetate decarboxylase gamma subunit
MDVELLLVLFQLIAFVIRGLAKLVKNHMKKDSIKGKKKKKRKTIKKIQFLIII